MNRTIKFRGQCKDTQEWFYGSYFIGAFNTHWIVTNDFVFTPVQQETVGQFTGLYDCASIEIYEGDVVRQNFAIYTSEYSYEGYHIGKVVILASKGACLLKPTLHVSSNNEETIIRKTNQYKQICASRCAILGNIHDNPRLILPNNPGRR